MIEMKHLLIPYIFLFSFGVFGQVIEETPPFSGIDLSKRFRQYRNDYPVGVNGETFLSGTADFKLSRDLGIRLERFYAQFGTQQQINAGVLLKSYVSKRLYLLSGVNNVFGIDQQTGELEFQGLFLNLGVGYQTKGSLNLEASYLSPYSRSKSKISLGSLNRGNKISLKARF